MADLADPVPDASAFLAPKQAVESEGKEATSASNATLSLGSIGSMTPENADSDDAGSAKDGEGAEIGLVAREVPDSPDVNGTGFPLELSAAKATAQTRGSCSNLCVAFGSPAYLCSSGQCYCSASVAFPFGQASGCFGGTADCHAQCYTWGFPQFRCVGVVCECNHGWSPTGSTCTPGFR